MRFRVGFISAALVGALVFSTSMFSRSSEAEAQTVREVLIALEIANVASDHINEIAKRAGGDLACVLSDGRQACNGCGRFSEIASWVRGYQGNDYNSLWAITDNYCGGGASAQETSCIGWFMGWPRSCGGGRANEIQTSLSNLVDAYNAADRSASKVEDRLRGKGNDDILDERF